MKLHSLVHLFLNQPVFQENKIYNFKVHLFSFLNSKQKNDCIYFFNAEENFSLVKIFWNLRVQL